MARPGHCLEPLFLNWFPAIGAFAVFAVVDSLQRFVNQLQKLPIVCRHRNEQLFSVCVCGHVSRILRRLSITFAAVSFGGLNYAHQAFATGQ